MIPSNYEDYKKIFCPDYKYISPKELKIRKVIALKGKDENYWKKCTSKQLGGIIHNNLLLESVE